MLMAAIGVDLGGTKIKAGLIDHAGQILVSVSAPTPQTGSGQDILDALSTLCRELTPHEPIQAIGIGTPGLISFPEGQILGCTPNLRDWQGRHLRNYFEAVFQCPVVVDNDANAACFGEWKAGAGKGLSDMVMLTLGTGLGSGLVLKGNLSRGHHQLGVGFGHMIVAADGRACNCGQQGCLETYVSGKGLLKNYLLLGGDPQLRGPEIFERAEAEDKLAMAALKQFIDMLAIGLVNIFNTLAPERILLGGGISAQGEKRLLEPLRQKVEGIMSMPFNVPEAIQLAHLGPDAGMIGAGLMAIEEAIPRI
jgi:glucokinase